MGLKKNFIYNLTLSVSQLFFPMITFPYASRILGADGIGITSFVESFSRYFLIFAVAGIPIHGVRQIAQLRDDKINLNNSFNEIFTIQFFLSLLVTIIYLLVVVFLRDFQLFWSLYLMGAGLILFNMFSLEWVFQGIEDFKYITIRTLIIRIVSIILLFTFVKTKNDLNWYFFLLIFSSVATGILNLKHIKKHFSVKITFNYKRLRKHLKPIIETAGYLISINIYLLSTTIILGFMTSNTEVGIYATAVKINRIALIGFGALSTILIPRLLYNAKNGDMASYNSTINQSINIIFTFGIPIVISIILMAAEIVRIFAGDGYDNAIICIQIMSPAIIFAGLNQVFSSQILIPFSRDKQNIMAVFIGAVLSVFINLILIHFIYVKGAAITMMVTELIVMIITFYFSNKIIKIEINLKNIIQNLYLSIPLLLFAIISKEFIQNIYLKLAFYLVATVFFFVFTQIHIVKNPIVLSIKKMILNNLFKLRV